MALYNAFIRVCYHEILNREPDQDGFESYIRNMAQGWTPADVVNSFLSSDEFLELDKTNGEIIDILYRILANRSASPDEKSQWRRFLGDHSMKDLINEVFHTFETPAQSPSSSKPSNTNEAEVNQNVKNEQELANQMSFVKLCYKKFIGREPKSEELECYENCIVHKGWSAAMIIFSFMTDYEYGRQCKSSYGNVLDIYKIILEREPNDKEEQKWCLMLDNIYSEEGKLNGHTEIINQLCLTEEAKSRFSKFDLIPGEIPESTPREGHSGPPGMKKKEKPKPQKEERYMSPYERYGDSPYAERPGGGYYDGYGN